MDLPTKENTIYCSGKYTLLFEMLSGTQTPLLQAVSHEMFDACPCEIQLTRWTRVWSKIPIIFLMKAVTLKQSDIKAIPMYRV